MSRLMLPLDVALVVLASPYEGHQPNLSYLKEKWLENERHIFEVSFVRPPLGFSALAIRHNDLLQVSHYHSIQSLSECAFLGSSLDLCLRLLSIRSLVFAGGLIDREVETNVRAAASLFYSCIIAQDCVAGISATIASYADLRNSDEVLKAAELRVD